ncbi:UNVERIFIED_CONTAM: hypothetical protein K2H54_009010 [Gekko kuhli]
MPKTPRTIDEVGDISKVRHPQLLQSGSVAPGQRGLSGEEEAAKRRKNGFCQDGGTYDVLIRPDRVTSPGSNFRNLTSFEPDMKEHRR